jgi:hypothetical protein
VGFRVRQHARAESISACSFNHSDISPLSGINSLQRVVDHLKGHCAEIVPKPSLDGFLLFVLWPGVGFRRRLLLSRLFKAIERPTLRVEPNMRIVIEHSLGEVAADRFQNGARHTISASSVMTV